MMKKTLVGAALAAAVMIPSGLAIAEPLEGADDATVATVADQTRTRDRLHVPGECDFDGEGVLWADRTGDGEQDRYQYRLHEGEMDQFRTEAHEPGEYRLDDRPVQKGPLGEGTGSPEGFQVQRGLNRG